ncbi:hypothetical protein GA0115251_11661, partial [Streptomyces sp. TverLS-915]
AVRGDAHAGGGGARREGSRAERVRRTGGA